MFVLCPTSEDLKNVFYSSIVNTDLLTYLIKHTIFDGALSKLTHSQVGR